MSNRSGSPYSAPTDADRRPVALGVSTVDGITPVPLEVNPSNGQLQVSSSGGGGGGTITGPLGSITAPSAVSTVLSSDYVSTATVKDTQAEAYLDTIVTNTTSLATTSNQTNGNQITQLVGGGNTVGALSSAGAATNQNSLITAGTGLTVPFSATSASNVASTSIMNYRGVSVQINTQGSGSVVNFQVSNDNTNWQSWPLFLSNNPSTTAQSSTGATGIIYYGPVSALYFRLNIAGISGGTTAGVVQFFTDPVTINTIPTSVSASNVTGNQASGSALNGDPVLVAEGNGTNAYTLLTNTMGMQIMGSAQTSVAVAISASLTVVKNAAGYLSGVLVSSAGTSTAMTFYDNASAASGKVIGIVPATATAGTFWPFNMPAANGITASGSATNPAVTVAYS